jgi:hypothetical protein
MLAVYVIVPTRFGWKLVTLTSLHWAAVAAIVAPEWRRRNSDSTLSYRNATTAEIRQECLLRLLFGWSR